MLNPLAPTSTEPSYRFLGIFLPGAEVLLKTFVAGVVAGVATQGLSSHGLNFTGFVFDFNFLRMDSLFGHVAFTKTPDGKRVMDSTRVPAALLATLAGNAAGLGLGALKYPGSAHQALETTLLTVVPATLLTAVLVHKYIRAVRGMDISPNQ